MADLLHKQEASPSVIGSPGADAPRAGLRWPVLICKINFRQSFFHPQLQCPNEICELIKNPTNCRGEKTIKTQKAARLSPGQLEGSQDPALPPWALAPQETETLQTPLCPALGSLCGCGAGPAQDGCDGQAPGLRTGMRPRTRLGTPPSSGISKPW